jgi:hypothetical protein
MSQCNKILKRLSVTHDTGFRGKILMLLASSVELNHKSGKCPSIDIQLGVNLKCNYNKENFTPIEDHPDGLSTQMQAFYKNFWTIQKYISNPALVSNTPADLCEALLKRSRRPRIPCSYE